MSTINIKNHQNILATIPNCCGNCSHNQWNETGPHCTNNKNWKLDEGETEICREDEDDDGYIEWYTTCDKHKRGNPFG